MWFQFILQVNPGQSFLELMDMFFKIHFVFCVPFEPSLAQFMSVFEKHVYGMESDDIEITPANKIKAQQIFSNVTQ